MAQPGQIDINPATGQPIVYLQTSAQTGGRLLEVETTYRAGGAAPPTHTHPLQEEHFEVLSGTLKVTVGQSERVLRAGDVLTIPAGTPHSMCCGGETDARVVWQTYPALRTEEFHERLWALAHAGETNARGIPSLPRMAWLLRTYRREFQLTALPAWLQPLVLTPLAFIAHLQGFRGTVLAD